MPNSKVKEMKVTGTDVDNFLDNFSGLLGKMIAEEERKVDAAGIAIKAAKDRCDEATSDATSERDTAVENAQAERNAAQKRLDHLQAVSDVIDDIEEID